MALSLSLLTRVVEHRREPRAPLPSHLGHLPRTPTPCHRPLLPSRSLPHIQYRSLLFLRLSRDVSQRNTRKKRITQARKTHGLLKSLKMSGSSLVLVPARPLLTSVMHDVSLCVARAETIVAATRRVAAQAQARDHSLNTHLPLLPNPPHTYPYDTVRFLLQCASVEAAVGSLAA